MHRTISGYANGTTVNMLPVDALRIPTIVLPPSRLVKMYSSVAELTRERRSLFITESLNLATKRDALLPKLVSGEVGVGAVI